MPETLYSLTLVKSYSGLQVKAATPSIKEHRYLHKLLIGVGTIKITVGAYCIRPTLKVQCYRAYFIRAYAIRPYYLHHNVIVRVWESQQSELNSQYSFSSSKITAKNFATLNKTERQWRLFFKVIVDNGCYR